MPALALTRPSNGTHMFIQLTGDDYGAVLDTGGCDGGVTVNVNGKPCDLLTMLTVRDSIVGLYCAMKGWARPPVWT